MWATSQPPCPEKAATGCPFGHQSWRLGPHGKERTFGSDLTNILAPSVGEDAPKQCTIPTELKHHGDFQPESAAVADAVSAETKPFVAPTDMKQHSDLHPESIDGSTMCSYSYDRAACGACGK